MKTITFCTLSALAWLCGCGAGDPRNETTVLPPPPTAAPRPVSLNTTHFEGIWQGSLTDGLSAATSPAILMVNGWGEFRLVADSVQFVGFPTRTATSVGGRITGLHSAESSWGDGSRAQEFELTGSIDADQFIDARYTGASDSGSFSLAWSAEAGPAPRSNITGTWARYDENQNIVATLQLGAAITGSDSTGCVYSGSADTWTSLHSYDVVPFIVSNCPTTNGVDLNGTYVGTAAPIDIAGDNSDELVLVMALSNENNQLTFFLNRIP